LEETLKEFMQLIDQPTISVSQQLSLEDTLKAFRQTVSQPLHEIKDAAMANTEEIARLEGQLGHLVVEFNVVEEVVKVTVNEPSLEDPLEACLAQIGDYLDLDKLLEQTDAILDPTPELQIEKGKTTEISFPNSSSLAAEPFILDNHSSMPSSYNHPPQESLVQHFPTTHFNDLEERVNQLMADRHAHTLPSLTLMHLIGHVHIVIILFTE
jgi:hypothetical protein